MTSGLDQVHDIYVRCVQLSAPINRWLSSCQLVWGNWEGLCGLRRVRVCDKDNVNETVVCSAADSYTSSYTGWKVSCLIMQNRDIQVNDNIFAKPMSAVALDRKYVLQQGHSFISSNMDGFLHPPVLCFSTTALPESKALIASHPGYMLRNTDCCCQWWI